MLRKDLFLKINTITLGSVLVLILVGSIVRSLGAGMGCPDWPKCFGSYVPPTSVEQLPEDYLDIFKAERLAKNERLSSMLSRLGYGKLADQVSNDPFVQEEQAFDVTKAWIEYINRLVGVLIGFLVLLNMVFAFSVKEYRSVAVAGVGVFVLTAFQGWVGSLVVSTNLLKGFITFHMVIALLIVAILIWMNVRSRNLEVIRDRRLFILSLVLLILFIPQLLLGTEVRAIVDKLLVEVPDRAEWAQYLTTVFLVHRSYSWLFLIGAALLAVGVRKYGYTKLKPPAYLLFGLIVFIALAGVIMAEFAFPFWAQPLHLIAATGIFSLLFYLTLRFKFANR